MRHSTQNRQRPRNALPADWPQRRKAVLARDNYRCRINNPRTCTLKATEVDHIVPRKAGGSHTMNNLRAVCAECHAARLKKPYAPNGWTV